MPALLDAKLVTVCIPTYRRPDVLDFALQSVIQQVYRPLEILVGDDSPDDLTIATIKRNQNSTDIPIRYWRNQPKLGQNANVDRLLREANGQYLILLHDDDRLLPDAISCLMEPVQRDQNVQVVFGKQTLITASGETMEAETIELNVKFRRTGETRAIQNPLEACLLQQMPNDAFLVKTALAQQVGYRSAEEIGVYVDVDFGIRVGQHVVPGQMWFIDKFVGEYRHSPNAISASSASRKSDHPLAAVGLFRALTAIDVPPASEYAREALVHSLIDEMVKGFALEGDRATALRLFGSRAYGWRKRLSARGAYHLALIASPKLDQFRRYSPLPRGDEKQTASR